MKFPVKPQLNESKVRPALDLYRAIIWQNRLLYALFLGLCVCATALLYALISRPAAVLLVDKDGRYVAEVNYRQAPPMNEQQLEALTKRFIQHYLSQNSATIYEDAALALAAMCPALRSITRQEWVEGGKLARVVERVQSARVVFDEWYLLKYLSPDDIQILVAGRVILSGGQPSGSASEFKLEMALKLVPLTANNYLGLEVCAINLI